MLVSGSGSIKITKDGKILLDEMQIQNPTASMIARTASAQDDVCGDGTTSNVLLIGELLKKAEQLLVEGIHPTVITDGFERAKKEVVEWMMGDGVRVKRGEVDRELLVCVGRCCLGTKVEEKVAGVLAEMVADAVLCVKGGNGGEDIDLFMVEIMTMEHMSDRDSKLVKGLVLDHGGRHPDMPKRLNDAFILTCNVSLEYEKSEVQSGFYYSNAEQREKMVKAEREVVDERIRKIIKLKKEVCDGTDNSFVVINQKGIDPQSLDLLAREGILGLRRAKRRNMERLTLACGGIPVNSVEDLTKDVLGFAGLVYEQVLADEKYTFVEKVAKPFSCTILLKGPNKHSIVQMKDAIRDGLRGVKNAIEDDAVLPGAGAFEVAAAMHLRKIADSVSGKAKLGLLAYADALMVIPKTLAETSGYDPAETMITLQDEHAKGNVVGLDLETGHPLDPIAAGIYDNFTVKKQLIELASVIASQLLLVDEVLRAGRDVNK